MKCKLSNFIYKLRMSEYVNTMACKRQYELFNEFLCVGRALGYLKTSYIDESKDLIVMELDSDGFPCKSQK